MLTLLPSPDFRESARVLDPKRLGKQRLEAFQLIRALLAGDESYAKDTPSVLMWKGHGLALVAYACAMCDEWVERGFRDNIKERLLEEVGTKIGMSPEALEGTAHQDVLSGKAVDGTQEKPTQLPVWLGREDIHASHRSTLLRWDPKWYEKYEWDVPRNVEIVWPVEPPPADAAGNAHVVDDGEGDPVPTSDPSPESCGDDDAGYAHSDPPEPNTQDTQGEEDMPRTAATAEPVAESSNDNLNREGLVDALRKKGYNGPVSYTKTRLVEMLETLNKGGTIDTPKRGRKAADDKEGSPSK